LRCALMSNGKIRGIKITGDFFMHPEERIVDLEQRLIGVPLRKKEIEKIVTDFFEEVVVVGASAKDFVSLILKTRGRGA